MKNLSWVFNGVLALAVVVLFVLYFSGDKDEAGKHSSNASELAVDQPAGEFNIAYVLIDSLLANYTLAQELTEELLKKKANLENELASKGQKLEKKIAEFQNQVQKRLITSWDAQAKEKQLTEEQQVFLNLQNDMQNRLMRDEQEMNQLVYETVIDYIDRYNEDNGFNMIISQTSGGVLLYAETYMNITKQVLEELNAEHLAAK
ncbi:MAG: OmpH family outer membrane protein [Bacteroidales bacterium]|nr:OmpH family outer membrane protein [Bacteroidales bacterium]